MPHLELDYFGSLCRDKAYNSAINEKQITAPILPNILLPYQVKPLKLEKEEKNCSHKQKHSTLINNIR